MSLPVRGTRWAAFLLIAILGLVLRIEQLGVRPMHTDEAVNAYIVGQLLCGRSFVYDPVDRHGPALAAVALPLARLQGAKAFADLTESELRLTSVLAGTATILSFGAAVEFFGFLPSLIAALLFAGASLPVYYDRYFIHEPLFVAATFLLILTALKAWTGRSMLYSMLAGAFAALMFACKETAVLHFLALAVAALCMWLFDRRLRIPVRFAVRATVAAVSIFLLLTVALYTWFGGNLKALADLLHAFPSLVARASGEGHQKPFWYYAQLLTGGRSGGLTCALALIGFIQAVRKRAPSPIAFLAFYAAFLAVTYSLIPYKTPWLTLNLWLPIALLAGAAIETLWRIPKTYPSLRVVVPVCCIVFGAVATVLIAHDTRQRVFVHPADESNPYAYAHTSEDLLGLPPEIEFLASQNHIAAPRIAVIAADPWPLPWYLRHFAQTGFWQPGQQPGQADFYITSTDAVDQYGSLLQSFHPDYFGVRPGVLIVLWSPIPK